MQEALRSMLQGKSRSLPSQPFLFILHHNIMHLICSKFYLLVEFLDIFSLKYKQIIKKTIIIILIIVIIILENQFGKGGGGILPKLGWFTDWKIVRKLQIRIQWSTKHKVSLFPNLTWILLCRAPMRPLFPDCLMSAYNVIICCGMYYKIAYITNYFSNKLN